MSTAFMHCVASLLVKRPLTDVTQDVPLDCSLYYRQYSSDSGNANDAAVSFGTLNDIQMHNTG